VKNDEGVLVFSLEKRSVKKSQVAVTTGMAPL